MTSSLTSKLNMCVENPYSFEYAEQKYIFIKKGTFPPDPCTVHTLNYKNTDNCKLIIFQKNML